MIYEVLLESRGFLDSLEWYRLSKPKAQDRRAFVRWKYGSWFVDHGFKLTRDYMVDFRSGMPGFVKLTILDAKKAVLFKLTWGGI